MHSSHIRKTLQAPLTGLLCLALVLPPAWAQTPDLRLSDLVNQGSDYARRELRSRSFVFIHADQRGFVPKGGWQSGYSAYSMWWNGSIRQCIQGVVSDGRIQSLNPIVEGNCL